MKVSGVIILLTAGALFILAPPQGLAQSKKEELAGKKKKLEEEIEYVNNILEETRKNKDASVNMLYTLKRKIQLRHHLISTINREIELLDRQIREHQNIVESMENDLLAIKQKYADMLLHAFKTRNSHDKLIFVFSAADFNQAHKRLRYLREYAHFRESQAGVIIKTQALLGHKILELEGQRDEKHKLLEEKRRERETLDRERSEQDNILKKLQSRESQLKKELQEKQQEAKRLRKAIEDIIAEEIRRAREAAKKASGFALTPEEEKLSANFAGNKGKLPWPVQRGIITGRFGEQEHPVLKGIKINNNGIDISTNQGAITRAVFDGTVTGVIILPGGGKKAIIIRHGEYFSVYSNLQEVFVKKGDHVRIKQDVGIVYTDEKNFRTEAHLEIWKLADKGTEKIDPQEWIAKWK